MTDTDSTGSDDGMSQGDTGVEEDTEPSRPDADAGTPDDTESESSDATSDGGTTDGGEVGGDVNPACQVDSDNDGLTDCEEQKFGSDPDRKDTDGDGLPDNQERQIGTDPRDGDTDGDGLSDFEELTKQTDPTKADTDGDGATDREELKRGLDPKDPTTYDDGTLDGDRWRLSACENPESAPVNFYESSSGNWTVALRPSFDNYRDSDANTGQPGNGLTINGTSPPVAAAVYGDPANEVAGFLLSKNAESNLNKPSDALQQRVAGRKLSGLGTLQQESTGGDFDTHDGHRASIGEYQLKVPQAQSTRKMRDQVLFALAEGSFQRQDVQGLPNSAGATYQTFQISVSVIYRSRPNTTQSLLSVGVAPAPKYANRSKTKAQVDDLVNTTNIASQIDTHLTRCTTFQPGTDVPKTEFYWVLDQSGSMDTDNQTVANFAQQFETEVRNTALRYRLGVTNMDEENQGRLEVNAAWHKSGSTFSSEIQNRVINCSSSGRTTLGQWECDGAREYGLKSARLGIRYMSGNTATPPKAFEKFRPKSNIITIFMSDEDAQRLKDVSNRDTVLKNFVSFFKGRTTAFSIVTGPNSSCRGNDAAGYRKVALETGGTTASLCANDLTKTIEKIIFRATGIATNYVLPQDPISSSLRVYLNDNWVPRSRDGGFAYFAEENSIAFFGRNYVPRSPTFECIQKYPKSQCDCNQASNNNCKIGEFSGDFMSVHYEAYQDRCKNSVNQCANNGGGGTP